MTLRTSLVLGAFVSLICDPPGVVLASGDVADQAATRTTDTALPPRVEPAAVPVLPTTRLIPTIEAHAGATEDVDGTTVSSTTTANPNAWRKPLSWTIPREQHQEWAARTGMPAILTHEFCWELAAQNREKFERLRKLGELQRSTPLPTGAERRKLAAANSAAHGGRAALDPKWHEEMLRDAEAHRAGEKRRMEERDQDAFRGVPTSFSPGQEDEFWQPFGDLGKYCEQYSGMHPSARGMTYMERMRMARGIILETLLAKNQHAEEAARAAAKEEFLPQRRRLEEVRGTLRSLRANEEENRQLKIAEEEDSSAKKSADQQKKNLENEERELADLVKREEDAYMEREHRPFIGIKLDPTPLKVKEDMEKRERQAALQKQWEENRDSFLRGGMRAGVDDKEERQKRKRAAARKQASAIGISGVVVGAARDENFEDLKIGGSQHAVTAGVGEQLSVGGSSAAPTADENEASVLAALRNWFVAIVSNLHATVLDLSAITSPNDASSTPAREQEENYRDGLLHKEDWAVNPADLFTHTENADGFFVPADLDKQLRKPHTRKLAARIRADETETKNHKRNLQESGAPATAHLKKNAEEPVAPRTPASSASSAQLVPAGAAPSAAASSHDEELPTFSATGTCVPSFDHDLFTEDPRELEAHVDRHDNSERTPDKSTTRRCLQSGDIRQIGIVNNMPNQTLVKKITVGNVVYNANEIPIRNRIPIPELLKDDNSNSNDPQLQADDNPYLTSFTLYNFEAKASLVMHQRRGSIFLYDVDSSTYDDVPRGVDFNEVLPPAMRFRFHSCKENNAFCHVQMSTYIDQGLVVLDRHRMMIVKYPWSTFAGVDRVYDKTVEDMVLRMPQLSIFGTMDIAGAGNLGLQSAEAVLRYQTHSDMVFVERIDAFTPGHSIANPDFLHVADTFLFVADTGNDRIAIFNLTTPESYSFYETFQMKDSLKPSPELNRPVALAMFLPGMEYRESPTYANIFLCDRLNHRVLKLNWGYYQYSEQYNFTIYDDFGLVDRIEQRTRYYRRWNRGPHLEYDSQIGGDTTPGGFSQGLLTEPISVQTFRHYIFVLQYGSDEIGVYTLNYNQTKEFLFVTKFTNSRKIEYGIGVSYNGYVWFAQQESRQSSYEKDLAVFESPRDLREGIRQYKADDLKTQCVDLDFYNKTIMNDPAEFVRVVSHALNISGLQYFYPNRTGTYVDLKLFNLSYVAEQDSNPLLTGQNIYTPPAMDFGYNPSGLIGPQYPEETWWNSTKAGFNFQLWNATIYGGIVMEVCEVYIPTPPPMLFGGQGGFVNQDGSALQQWDISAAYDHGGKRRGVLLEKTVLLLFMYCVWFMLFHQPRKNFYSTQLEETSNSVHVLVEVQERNSRRSFGVAARTSILQHDNRSVVGLPCGGTASEKSSGGPDAEAKHEDETEEDHAQEHDEMTSGVTASSTTPHSNLQHFPRGLVVEVSSDRIRTTRIRSRQHEIRKTRTSTLLNDKMAPG
ncbi:unnamed protein product [Amoebophrya sp. A120]|nr:unnamed protein product [Amoebophrya sp. A120]|eukprot:GSA120T00003253001.1